MLSNWRARIQLIGLCIHCVWGGGVDVTNDKCVLFFNNLTFRSRWQRGFNCNCCQSKKDCGCGLSPPNVESVYGRRTWANTVRVDINVLCVDKSPTRAASLLLLFMQQPWAVAGCMKILVIYKHVQNGAAVRYLYEMDVVSRFEAMCQTLLWALSRSLGGRSLRFCRVGVFAAWTKDWME